MGAGGILLYREIDFKEIQTDRASNSCNLFREEKQKQGQCPKLFSLYIRGKSIRGLEFPRCFLAFVILGYLYFFVNRPPNE
jgi:hypothetical protein